MASIVNTVISNTDFSGISLAPTSVIKPNPEPAYQPGAAIGPGYNSSAETGLSLPMTAAHQYNVNYWSVVQCGQNKASLWLNGWGYHLPKDTPTQKLSGYHLAIGGSRGLAKGWNAPNKYVQFNYLGTLGTSYHVGSCLTQHYVSTFLYIPASGNFPARSVNVIVQTWASRDNGYFNEYISRDTNYNGVGVFVQAPLKSTSRYITPWSGSLAFGAALQGLPRLIGFNITRKNMAAIGVDYAAAIGAKGAEAAYLSNPDNWYINGCSFQLETMWPNEDRPAGGGPMPGQAGMKIESAECNVFA